MPVFTASGKMSVNTQSSWLGQELRRGLQHPGHAGGVLGLSGR